MTDATINDSAKYVYLVQHGEAKSEAEDPERSLTEQGKQAVEQVAAWAARVGLKLDEIRHSGKRRSEQTAGLFAQHLDVSGGTVAVSGLAPNDDVLPIARALEQEARTVMLVGHLPFLSRLASQLLIKDSEQTIIRFRMAGLVGLQRNEEGWSVACVVPPDMVA